MAARKVIAFVMHETERHAAEQVLGQQQSTDSFVMGMADDAEIARMQGEGLLVVSAQGAEDIGATTAETPGAGAMPFAPFAMGATTIDVAAVLARGETVGVAFDAGIGAAGGRAISFSRTPIELQGDEDDSLDLTKPLVYLIQTRGPMMPDYQSQLVAAGGEILESYGNGYYSVRIKAGDLRRLDALTFVGSRKLYGAADTAPSKRAGRAPGLTTLGAAMGGDARRMVTWDLRLHRPEDLREFRAWLDDHHVPVAGEGSRKIRVYLLDQDPRTREIAAHPLVQKIEEHVPPKLANDRARITIGIASPAASLIGQDGTGELVAIADSGVDQTHPDLVTQIQTAIGLGRPGVTDDPHGHGTHVCGSVAGSGAASGGAIVGVAPGARIYMQSLLDPSGELGGVPVDLTQLFDPAYQAGARIHSNSWGSPMRSTYTASSDEVDEFAQNHKDMLILFAAGNDGDASQTQTKGVVDWLSIRSPATAKNALTVGASCTDRTTGPSAGKLWNQIFGGHFPDPLIGTDPVCGNPESLAAFSSRGPSDDRRIKPDLVAPGTDILSTRSSTAPDPTYWGTYAADPRYAYLGGTSMATPLVAGCAALVRQYYREVEKHKPSGALVRATLINGTKWLSGRDANESNTPGLAQMVGNYDQGFGRIDLAASLPNPTKPWLRLAFSDDWEDPSMALGYTGARQRFTITVNGGAELRLCMAYADAPGRGLQNNLNLFLQLPSMEKRIGNAQLRSSPGPIPDVDNNVEVIRIVDPDPGDYLVQITATNLLRPPQDFALVVTGDLAGGLTQI